MSHIEQKKTIIIPHIEPSKFIERSNGTLKGYSVNTFHGLVKNYNEDRVSIIMNITKPNFNGRWPRCSYFGVFDGHGGNKCSDFLKQNMHKYITENGHFPHEPIEALKFGFKKAEQQFMNYAESQNPVERSGSCALVLLVIDEIVYIANVGDSRAILSTNMGKNVYPISKDHKPDSDTEKQRIFQAGGKIYQSSLKNKNGQTVLGPFRIEPGKLSVSRSFGDIQAKLHKYDGNPKVLIAKPQITYFQINSEQHDFIVMCSDGIYDKMTNQEVVECFWDSRNKHTDDKYQFIGTVPSRIIQRSMEKVSMDNLTSLVIVFEDNGRLLLPIKKSITNVENRQATRRPQSYIDTDYQKNKLSQNAKNKQQRLKNDTKTNRSSQINNKIDEVSSSLQSSGNKQDKQNHKEGAYNREPVYNNRNQKQNIQKLLQRKSTVNLSTGINEKKDQNCQSLSNSISAKMLMAGSKASPNQRIKDKVNINELLQKKKSMDNFRKDKDLLWKQVASNPKAVGERQDKLIRF